VMVFFDALQVSLYEEIAGAWVLARHEWLASRPLGKKLIDALGSSRLYHHCAGVT
jgi:fucokinase